MLVGSVSLEKGPGMSKGFISGWRKGSEETILSKAQRLE